jgi:hypothetical protein
MSMKPLSEEEARRINKILVPTRYIGTGKVYWDDKADPEETAFVQLDARERPDVADLARVVWLDGIAGKDSPPLLFGVEAGNEEMLVRTTIKEPVACEFAYSVPWRGNEDFFDLVAQTGVYYVTAGEIPGRLDKFVGHKVDKNDIQDALAHWRRAAP